MDQEEHGPIAQPTSGIRRVTSRSVGWFLAAGLLALIVTTNCGVMVPPGPLPAEVGLCSIDAECDPTHFCNADGVCQPRPCEDSTTCSCNQPHPDTPGVCVPEAEVQTCQHAGDCGPGQTCDVERTVAVCVDEAARIVANAFSFTLNGGQPVVSGQPVSPEILLVQPAGTPQIFSFTLTPPPGMFIFRPFSPGAEVGMVFDQATGATLTALVAGDNFSAFADPNGNRTRDTGEAQFSVRIENGTLKDFHVINHFGGDFNADQDTAVMDQSLRIVLNPNHFLAGFAGPYMVNGHLRLVNGPGISSAIPVTIEPGVDVLSLDADFPLAGPSSAIVMAPTGGRTPLGLHTMSMRISGFLQNFRFRLNTSGGATYEAVSHEESCSRLSSTLLECEFSRVGAVSTSTEVRILVNQPSPGAVMHFGEISKDGGDPILVRATSISEAVVTSARSIIATLRVPSVAGASYSGEAAIMSPGGSLTVTGGLFVFPQGPPNSATVTSVTTSPPGRVDTFPFEPRKRFDITSSGGSARLTYTITRTPETFTAVGLNVGPFFVDFGITTALASPSAPSVTSFTPTMGANGITVTINGTNLAGVTQVLFNGIPADTFQVISATQIRAVVPADATTGPIGVVSPTGTAQSAAPFRVQPVVTDFDPASGIVGTTATVTGSGFTGATAVKFGNAAAAIFRVLSSTQVAGVVPPGASTGRISVTTPGGTGTSATDFVVDKQPMVTSANPPAAPEGALVTFTGVGFTNVIDVTFTMAPTQTATNTPMLLSPTSLTVLSPTSLRATVPMGAITGPVRVTNPAGTGQSATPFRVIPVITGFTPATAIVGANVSITGQTFTGATAVRFGTVNAAFTVLSNTEITAVVPATAPALAKITVVTPGGTAVSAGSFNAILPPTISAFTPTMGPVGTAVTINGANLNTVTNVMFATSGTNSSVVPTILSATSIRAVVPVGAVTGPITVTNPAGSRLSTLLFKVLPRITGFSPLAALVGANVSITGNSFTGATAVRFGTINAAFTVLSDTEITALVPNGALTAKLTVVTPGGTAVSAGSFTPIYVPTIASFVPPAGAVGSTLTITGTNLGTVTDVAFTMVGGNSSVAPAMLTPTSLQVIVPAGARTGPIAVTNPAGSRLSALLFKVLPRITGFSPLAAVVGANVSITGTSFTGATAVRFGTLNAAFTVLSDTEITALVPNGAVTAPLTLVTPGGTAVSAAMFTPIYVPTIAAFVPPAGAVGSTLTINGTNLGTVTDVAFTMVGSNSSVAPTMLAPTSLRVIVPAGARTGPITVTNPAGSRLSTLLFKVLPRITGFTPLAAVVGANVSITGSSFTGATAVRFGAINAAFTVLSDTEITALVPNGAVTAPLTVVTPGGTAVSAPFTPIYVPTIAAFVPPAGAVGSLLTINGTNLGTVTDVAFTMIGSNSSVAPTMLTPTSLRVIVPAGARTGPITVTNPAGSRLSTLLFKVLPRITGFTPLAALVGANVSITGNSFTGATAVRFGAINAVFTVLSDAEITAVVPNGAVTAPLTVVTPGGTAVSAPFTPIYVPTIAAFVPPAGTVGSTVTINGTNLGTVTDVAFTMIGSNSSVAPTVLTPTSLRVSVPVGARTGPITVTNPAGSRLSTLLFKVLPRITDFSPSTGIVGANVSITGNSFTGASAVRFGTINAAFTVLSDTEITALVPATAPALAKITVVTPAGTALSTASFAAILPPTIGSFTPAAGAAGAMVTITGTNLNSVTGVTFTGTNTSVTPTVVSATSIRAVVPAGATTGPITVTNPAGSRQSAASFRVLPAITGIAPTSGSAGSSVTITGQSFTGATAVRFGTVLATSFTVDSDTQITAVVPATAPTAAGAKLSVTTPGGVATSAQSFSRTVP